MHCHSMSTTFFPLPGACQARSKGARPRRAPAASSSSSVSNHGHPLGVLILRIFFVRSCRRHRLAGNNPFSMYHPTFVCSTPQFDRAESGYSSHSCHGEQHSQVQLEPIAGRSAKLVLLTMPPCEWLLASGFWRLASGVCSPGRLFWLMELEAEASHSLGEGGLCRTEEAPGT
jgi:hypothetical protein